MTNRMYADTVTWNPFKGCEFHCIYCEPSFQRQAKRQKHNCKDCYEYNPHFHPERLNQYLPKNKLIFVCGNGDLAFARDSRWIDAIIKRIKETPDRTFLIQSKNPEWMQCYENHEGDFPDNVILGTTIETNRETYEYSDAPETINRAYMLMELRHKRKFVTHEPIMDFDLKELLDWDKRINPEIIWIGYNSHPEYCKLPEPSLKKARDLIIALQKLPNTDVRLKLIRSKEG